MDSTITGGLTIPAGQMPPAGELPTKMLTYEPTDQERWFIERAQKRVRFGDKNATRWALERQWYENLLFLQGEQWIGYNARARTLTGLQAPAWFPMPVDNQIWPRAERLAAQFLKRAPSARVRPNSNSGMDRQAAHDGEELLAHIDDVVDETTKRQLAAYAAVTLGHVFSKEWFNANAGRIYAVPRTTTSYPPMMRDVASCPSCALDFDPSQAGQPCPDCTADQPTLPAQLQPQQRRVTMSDGTPAIQVVRTPELDPQGQQIVDRFYEGEIRSEVLLPFEVYVDENADSLENAEWIAHVAWRPMEWIQRAFPDRADYVKESSGLAVSSFQRRTLMNVIASGAEGLLPVSSAQLNGGAVVVDYEEMPSRYFPAGIRIILAGDVLMFASPLPIGDEEGGLAELSYSDFRYAIVSGCLWGSSPITQLIPLQRTINSIRSHLILNRKMMASPGWLAPEGSGFERGNVMAGPGAVYTYIWNGMGTAPQQVPGQALPSQVMDELNLCFSSMDRIVATEDAAMNGLPSGMKSGVALAQISEQAETTHAPRATRWEAFIARRGRKRLLIAQRFYQEPRLVKTLGAGSVWQVRRLTGADLRGNIDVTVEAGSSLPRSRMAQLQLILDLLQMGVLQLDEPGIREKLLDEMGLSAITPEMEPDHRKALVENAMLDSGALPRQVAPFSPQLPTVGKYEQHEVHVREHMLEIADPRFDQKPPAAQQAYIRHLQEHRFAALIGMQLEAQAPAQPEAQPPAGPEGGGGKPGGGGASKPPASLANGAGPDQAPSNATAAQAA